MIIGWTWYLFRLNKCWNISDLIIIMKRLTLSQLLVSLFELWSTIDNYTSFLCYFATIDFVTFFHGYVMRMASTLCKFQKSCFDILKNIKLFFPMNFEKLVLLWSMLEFVTWHHNHTLYYCIETKIVIWHHHLDIVVWS